MENIKIKELEAKIKELKSNKNTKMDLLLIQNWKRSINLIKQQ